MDLIWLDRQMLRCTNLLQGSISAEHLMMRRPAFGQVIIPKKGSVLASPRMVQYPDPFPDYFFHWLRDSALVMDVVTLLGNNAKTAKERHYWNGLFNDFVDFSRSLNNIKGWDHIKSDHKAQVEKGCRRWLRNEVEIKLLAGDNSQKEPRFNPDGTPDILKWARPQYDGAALRALTCLRHWDVALEQKRSPSAELKSLLLGDLDFTLQYADAPGIGPWEKDKEFDHHYYSAVTQLGALHHGAVWAAAQGDQVRADSYCRAAENISINLDHHWDEFHKFYTATRNMTVADPEDHLDISVIMGVIHARLPAGKHSIQDERVMATLQALETMFARVYPINQQRAPDIGLAMGRFKSDGYFSGGAYYFSTFAAAEFYYRQALHHSSPAALIGKGDAILEMAKQTIPVDGRLSEQFSQVSGQQDSAQDLTWSYASFITAHEARRQASEYARQLLTGSALKNRKDKSHDI